MDARNIQGQPRWIMMGAAIAHVAKRFLSIGRTMEMYGRTRRNLWQTVSIIVNEQCLTWKEIINMRHYQKWLPKSPAAHKELKKNIRHTETEEQRKIVSIAAMSRIRRRPAMKLPIFYHWLTRKLSPFHELLTRNYFVKCYSSYLQSATWKTRRCVNSKIEYRHRYLYSRLLQIQNSSNCPNRKEMLEKAKRPWRRLKIARVKLLPVTM